MKEMVGCANCESTFTGNGKMLCPECGYKLVPFNVTEITWDTMNKEEKSALKKDIFGQQKSLSEKQEIQQQVIMSNVAKIAKDVRIMRNILIAIVAIPVLFIILGFGR